jgi:NADH-quinone oxidoreductase subunit G
MPDMETVTLTIDGRPVTVAKGTTVLQAAIQAGIYVPFYCYHPGLGIDGSCRVCIVKIEKMPKLQTACSTVCTDGMVVSTTAPEVVDARAGVFEFLLINHPLDCPVCDKGGECPLQDFAYRFGPNTSRMEFPRRTFDGEGAAADVDFGPTLMLNRNRCILCTRCVRFMREIDGDAQIAIVDRGYGSQIATFEERGVISLLSGNLADICPVGAITTKDYRFKSRPWDNPQAVDTICTLCEKGCNTTVWLKAKPEWVKAPRLVRITPRYQPEVNGYWMCDIGRFGYHWVDSSERLLRCLIRRPDGGVEASTWTLAFERLRELLWQDGGPVRFLVSAHASLEELFLVRQIAERIGAGVEAIALGWRTSAKGQPEATKFKIPAVDAPNVRGARDLGLPVGPDDQPNLSDLIGAVQAGRVGLVWVIDPGPPDSLGETSWLVAARRTGRLPRLVVQGVVANRLTEVADLVLPGATAFEKEASYSNGQGRVQGASRVLAAPGEAKEDWQILVEAAAALGQPLPYRSSRDVREAIAASLADQPAYAGLGSLEFARPTPARTWLDTSNPSERWKWTLLFQDLAPLKFAPGTPPPPRPDVTDSKVAHSAE